MDKPHTISETQRKQDFYLGLYFIYLQPLVLLIDAGSFQMGSILWVCHHAPLLFGLSFLFHKYNIAWAVCLVSFIPQLIWMIDFFVMLLFNIDLWGYTFYMFQIDTHDVMDITFFLEHAVSVIFHLFVANIALIFLLRRKILNIYGIVIALIYIGILYVLTILFVDRNYYENTNCVYENCAFSIFDILPDYVYFLIWPLLVMILAVIPTYILVKLWYKIWGILLNM